jgi:hypothetical protein
MTDIYRPLYVLVEAVEAEIKRLLPPTPPPAPRYDGPRTQDYEHGLRSVFRDDSICVQRLAGEPKMMVMHRCKVCDRHHKTTVSEIAPTKHVLVERLVSATRAMMEAPCDIELRTP